MAATKKNFVLRLSEEAYAALARWAEDEFRSVNGQMEMLLDRALKEAGRFPPPKERQVADKPDEHARGQRKNA
jgi:hypothetical protein